MVIIDFAQFTADIPIINLITCTVGIFSAGLVRSHSILSLSCHFKLLQQALSCLLYLLLPLDLTFNNLLSELDWLGIKVEVGCLAKLDVRINIVAALLARQVQYLPL